MEGSAIARDSKLRSISNAKDPDMDGNSKVHPTSQSIVEKMQQPKGLGRDSFVDSDPRSGSKIYGGQNG
jgi:hypothetical protein